jgi:hypothetical protein
MKYFFLLNGFELRTFNDAVEKNKKNYREGREKNPGNLPVREGKYILEISPSGRLRSGARTTGHGNFPRIYLQCRETSGRQAAMNRGGLADSQTIKW